VITKVGQCKLHISTIFDIGNMTIITR